MRRTALVTGGTGFIGRQLLVKLLEREWDVHCLCVPGTEGRVAELASRGLQLHAVTDASELWRAEVAGLHPDVVFHLASLFIAEHVPADVEPLVRSNVLFGALLLDAMSEGGCHRLVNIGSSWQHYQDAEYDPVCLYAATKQAFEDLAEYYVRARALRMVTLSLFDTYGPDDDRPKLVPTLLDLSRNGGRLGLSPGDQQVDLVYADDVVAAILVASDRLMGDGPDVHGHAERYAVDSGAPVSLKDLVALVERLSGTKIDVEWGARPYRSREVMRPWRLGVRLPGWMAEVPLSDGLRRCIDDARNA
jgi:nucleoside-diphosphate-sugar epimerase